MAEWDFHHILHSWAEHLKNEKITQFSIFFNYVLLKIFHDTTTVFPEK